ncbi:homeobox protein prospero-like isoform X1 [Lethenteron reissneri]|uniref:homeobox protein prospero-like isoform X1 n=1 Tax=Lethenteron reissneri TaxID=7753 RepID=UPI002AB64749|nr:homeobox protein prospero-like isoform X1 [Lethenteron reissneri]
MSYQLPGAAVDKGGSIMSDSHRLHHHHQQHHHHHHQQQQQQQLLQQPHHHSHQHHHHAGQRDAAIAAWSRCNSSSNNSGAKGPGLGPTCEGDPTANTLPSRRGAQRATAFRSHGRTDARSPLALAKVEAPAPYGDSHCKSSARPPATAATAASGRLRGGDAAGGQRDLAQYVRGYLEAGGRDVGAEWEERYYATFSRSVECCSSDNNSRETSPVKANARSTFSTADSTVRGVQQGASTAGVSNRALPQQGIGAAGSSGRGAPNVGDSGSRSKDAGSATACTRGCEGDGASEGSSGGGSKSETRLTANGAHEGIPRIDIHECCYDGNAAAAAVDESGTLKVLGAAMGNSEQKGVQVGNSFSRSTKSKLGGSVAGDGKERSALSVMHSIGVQTEAACKQNNGGGSPSTPSAPSSNASKHSSDGLSGSVDGASGTASGGGEKRSNSDEEGSEGFRDNISDIFRFLDDVSVCDSGTGPMHSRNDSCNSLARNLKSDSDCTPECTPRKHAEQPTPLGSLSLSEQDHHLLQEVHLLQQEYKQQQKQRDQQKHKDNNNHQGKQQTQLSRVSRQRGASEPDDELKVSVCKLVLRMGEIERKLETLTGVRAEISEVLAKLNKLDEKLVQEALPCLQSPTDEKPGEEYDNNGQQQCSRGHRAHMPKSESGTEWGSSDASCGDSLRVQALRRSLLGRRSSRSLAEDNSATESKLVSMASSPHGDWKSGSSSGGGGGGGGGGAGGGGGVVGGGCGMISGAVNGSGAVEKVAGCSNISGCPGMGGGGNNNSNLVTSGLYVYEPGREYERRERYGDGQSGPIQMEVGYAFSAKPDNVQADEALVQQVYGGRISASTLRAHMKSNPLYREVPAGPGGEADGQRRGQPSWTLEEYTRHAKQRGKLSAIDLQTQESLNPNNLEYWMEEIYTPGYDSLLKRKEAEFRRAKLCKIAVLVLVAVCTVVLVIVVPICTVRT